MTIKLRGTRNRFITVARPAAKYKIRHSSYKYNKIYHNKLSAFLTHVMHIKCKMVHDNYNIKVEHGSADTVVRAMNVKYRKWHLGGPVTPKPLNRFPQNLASVIKLPTQPHMQNLVTIGSKGAWLRMREIRR